ncbi:ATP-dependent DNA helicase [uncultured Methanobrevibacter sp.]|uniref:ATP-dependent DNA helicase n=1 Tax=uncultured Methanobrevibacter sp. TaxID=253161 RepID=UPI0025DDE67B|nr:ATP-dependent DNA helicase [uncultured Methanobrevibacter sp.]
MRVNSVFSFLETKFHDLYDLCIMMEKLIVLKKYRMAIGVGKVILDLFCKKTAQQLVFTIDVFNDFDLHFTLADARDVHSQIYEIIYENYFNPREEFLKVYYDFDLDYLGSNVTITNDELFLFLNNLKADTISPKVLGRSGDDMLFLEDFSSEERKVALEMVKNNLNRFIREDVLTLNLVDREGNDITRGINFEAQIKQDYCRIKEIPPEIELDDYQIGAVEYDGDKPLVINAGPGAGKTSVIIERVLHLLKTAKPSSILVITFTNKAADELRERFKKDTKLELSVINQMRISTIHSYCRSVLSDFSQIPYNLLKRDSERNLFFNKHKDELGFVGEAFLRSFESSHALKKYEEYALFEVDTESLQEYVDRNFSISDEYREWIREYFSNNAQYPSKKEIKYRGFDEDLYNARFRQIVKSYPDWIDLMEREHVCDQNYLLIKALELLSVEDNLKRVEYRNILIDEFQDTDAIQMQIFKKLRSIADTFTVVGDADQSIYSFRGANPKFFTDYANSDEFENRILVNNYRSSSDIVEFNERYIESKRQTQKNLKASNSHKMPVYLLENRDDMEEYRSIAFVIKNLMLNHKIERYSDVAVLFRSHRDKKEILDVFDREGIPYYLKGIDDLIYQDEAKAVLALFWYILPFNPTLIARYGDGGHWINLLSFTDRYYKSSKIFNLSYSTIQILEEIEFKYHQNVVSYTRNYDSLNGRNDSSSFMDVIRDYSDSVLDDIFKKTNKIDISSLTREELKGIGISDEHDLDFFCSLNDLKSVLFNQDIDINKKPTSLQVFYRLLNATGYLEELSSRSDFEARKASLNLALISGIISDYENIMGKHDIIGLFNYLHRSLKYYSCPINEYEDNSNKVHIMTVHKAKGLEYPVVITASLKENKFPIVFRNTKSEDYERPTYPTPNRFLKYKMSEDDEISALNHEEERIVYVANTRAEELLILSCVQSRINYPLPDVLMNFEKEYGQIERLEPDDTEKLKKVTSHMHRESNLFRQIEFENVLDDYLYCPLKYNLENNLNYQNPRNINKFINSKLQVLLNAIHNPKLDRDWSREEIHNLVNEVIKSYGFASKSMKNNLKELFDHIADYWLDYGRSYDIVEYSYPVTLEIDGYDVNGIIDLIVKENDTSVNLIHFIRSRDDIRNYHYFYMETLFYYAYALLENDDFEINSLILHVLDENKQYEIGFDKSNRFIYHYLSAVISHIEREDYPRHEINCRNCEFSGVTCMFESRFD